MPRASQRVVSDDEFDDEDLDQLDESDHEEVSNTQTAAKANNLLFGALQKPRPVTVNCKQLYGMSLLSISWEASRGKRSRRWLGFWFGRSRLRGLSV
jgi:hypothetical protein